MACVITKFILKVVVAIISYIHLLLSTIIRFKRHKRPMVIRIAWGFPSRPICNGWESSKIIITIMLYLQYQIWFGKHMIFLYFFVHYNIDMSYAKKNFVKLENIINCYDIDFNLGIKFNVIVIWWEWYWKKIQTSGYGNDSSIGDN